MRIVIYTGYHTNPWDPNNINNTGLGGTEQSVLYLAKYLVAKSHYKVWVVGTVNPGDYEGVHYRNTSQFKSEVEWVDTIIGVSYINYLKEFEDFNYKNSLFWVHNTDYYPWWNGEEIPNHRELLSHPKLTNIICLTYWHKYNWIEQFPETKDKILVIPNGIDYKSFVNIFPQPKMVDGKLFSSSPFFLPKKNQDQYIKQQERFIERFKAKNTKAKQAQSKQKQLEKVERIEIDDVETSAIKINFPPAPRSGDKVLIAKDLSKHYEEKKVLNHAEFEILRGEKVAFVGKNGMGKTTMVKLINGLKPTLGEINLGHNVKLGYYAQIQENTLNAEETVFETLDNIATDEWRKVSRLRGLLGAFLFGAEEIDKKVKVLSGGEKSRLAIAKLLLDPYNLLVLDEPTNHLDMSSKEILKNALNNYDGTLIIVSHDRDFLQGLTNKTYEFIDGKGKEHLGTID